MPRATDHFRERVKFLSKTTWNCKFCRNQYAGSATRIKAHLAGVAGYGIHGCKVVNGKVRSEAQKALKGKGLVESSNRLKGNVQGSSCPHLISSSLTQGAHQPVAVSNEDAWREPSATPILSSNVISTVGASSSAFSPLHETNVTSQSVPAQNMIPQRDFSFWPQQPQSHAGDSYIQPRNLSYPSSRDLAPEALNNMPVPVNAEEEEPQTEVPQDARTDDALMDSRLGSVDEYMPTLKKKREELSRQEANLDELETWCRKAKRMKVEYWSMIQAFREGRSLSLQQVERVDNLSKEVEEILGHCSFQKGSTTHVAGCTKSSPLVTTELVGKESEETIEKICDNLMEDEIVIIGIYGMGGVGKTAILMHVHNKVLENPAFNDVFWVTVPQNFSVYELQDEIANVVGLDNLLKEKDVKRRASILNRHLKKKRSVLLLDGLWLNFEIEDVGIPIEKGGLKLVLTTRSLDVCHKMLCQKQIKIEPLCWQKDCWSLFLKKLCFGKELPLEVKKIASSILRKCWGLPLGIIEIATHMRGVEKVHKWKDLLQKLEDSMMELDVFKKLKLSYMNLGNPQVQQCFLHLVSCFEGCSFGHVEDYLIESFIDEGLLGGIATRQKLHDQGNTIRDKLRDACLYDDPEEEFQEFVGVHPLIRDKLRNTCLHDDPEEEFQKFVGVHPLIRDMALQIMTRTHMVKAVMGLKEIPEEEFWTNHLEKVFLHGNEIKEIPYGISPNCPKLTRLSLNGNGSLEAIHESFFRHLMGLKVLDLSNTRLMELPDSISHLESLEALLLRCCKELRRIPCVGKLGSLRKIDLRGCTSLEEVPERMEMLVKLRYLDVEDTKIETLPEGVLEKLVNLQYLAIKKMRAGEEANLKKVEELHCSVPKVETFNACVRFLEQNSSRCYTLAKDAPDDDRYWYRDEFERRIFINSCDHITPSVDQTSGDGCALLPKSVQTLQVSRCHKMKRVLEWEWLTTHLLDLKTFIITDCEEMEEIIARPLPSDATCLLRTILIDGCNFMKRELLMQDTLLRLPFLQQIIVGDCKGIEVIIGTVPNMTPSSFPKLTHLVLSNLPELKSISDGNMSCDSIEDIYIDNCPKLRLSMLDNGLPSPPPSLRKFRINHKMWKSLDWDHPLARSSLEHSVRFIESRESSPNNDGEGESFWQLILEAPLGSSFDL